MAIQVPAPSSFGFTSESKYSYDVFLSFRGEDTRHSFTSALYYALRKRGINTFIDDKKLGKGKRISPALLRAIEKSRISIIVFSTNYATSSWCLDELDHIVWCKKEKKQIVMPIFYKVDPTDVQYQRNSFGEAMAAHEDRFGNDMERVRKWRSALSEAAGLSSEWIFEDGYRYESGFIERIVEDAYAKLPPKRLHSTDHMVGLESRIEELKSLLDQSDKGVCILVIHGIGGIGKTTLAMALYNSIFCQFEGASFLFDVREASEQYRGIVRLQQTLLSEILEEKRMKWGSVDEGISKIKHRLSRKRVLLVLDDVDDIEQLEQLAGGCDWFGSGSKIIITTRNKQLLTAHHVEKTYEMKMLDEHESLELFCWHAFHMSQPPKGYEDMSDRVVSYAQGLPLALRVIGSNLAHKSIEEWISIWEQYERIPERTIHEVLKISYDCLQDNAKGIFLDIACFFNKWTSIRVAELPYAYDFGARFFIEVLVEKSLVSFDGNGFFRMHDLIQEMGREVVRLEAPSNPMGRSRLWYYKDVLRVLRENSGSSNIEGIMLNPPQQEEVEWSGLAFEKMDNLRILIVRNAHFSTGPKCMPNNLKFLDWEGYPCMTLPPDFYPKKIVVFRLCGSRFRLREPFKRFEYMTNMRFSNCEFVTEVPDLSEVPNLRELIFNECPNLIKVDGSVGSLSKLITLDVSGCTELRNFPREINMASLIHLNVQNCKSLGFFPNTMGKMDALTTIIADDTAIEELPHSIGNLSGLQFLNMNTCKSLMELPSSLFTLPNLHSLSLGDSPPRNRKLVQESQQEVIGCTNLTLLDLKNSSLLDEDVHLALNYFRNLVCLNLSGNDFVSLPECIRECANLLELDVNNCKRLRNIPELPSKLKVVKAEDCTSLTPESLGRLWSQARKVVNGLSINMPETAFPDWLDHCCKGGTLCFRARGNFPLVALAFQLGKANASVRSSHGHTVPLKSITGHISINGRKVKGKGHTHSFVYSMKEGNVSFCDPRRAFWHWDGLDGFLTREWNDVKIKVRCRSPDLSVVKFGVYVCKQQTNMENVRFTYSLLSRNAPTSLLKRGPIASLPYEPNKKLFMSKFKATDQGKNHNTKTRRIKRHQYLHSCDRSKMIFPMGKHVWRFLYS